MEWFGGVAVVALVVAVGIPLRVAAGGRICACDESPADYYLLGLVEIQYHRWRTIGAVT